MVSFNVAQNMFEFIKIYNNIKNIGQYYPNFYSWYFNKVIPSALLHEDKLIYKLKDNEFVGSIMIKNTENEKKIRCLRIQEKFQSKGYALHLMDLALKELNCDKPNLSVPEELFHDYSRIFVNRYNFDLNFVHKGLYRKNKLEYEYNGNTLIKNNINYGVI